MHLCIQLQEHLTMSTNRTSGILSASPQPKSSSGQHLVVNTFHGLQWMRASKGTTWKTLTSSIRKSKLFRNRSTSKIFRNVSLGIPPYHFTTNHRRRKWRFTHTTAQDSLQQANRPKTSDTTLSDPVTSLEGVALPMPFSVPSSNALDENVELAYKA